jgi:hypothetical protein
MRKILLVVLVSMIGFGCSKYDENPAFSGLPKKVRITGFWLLKAYVDEEFGEIEVDEEQALLSIVTFRWDGTGTEGEGDITWYFSKDKKSLVVSYDDDPSTYYKENILKLTNKELWLGTIEDGYKKLEKQ